MSDAKPWCQVHVGTVIAVNKWSDTHVSASGGGGYVSNQGGYIHAPTVSSTVTQNIEIFSRDDNGHETKLSLSNTSIAFREGSKILAVWGAEHAGHDGSIYYVENLDTNEVFAPAKQLLIKGWHGAYNGLGLALLLTLLAAIPLSAFSGDAVVIGCMLTFVIAWPTLKFIKSRRLMHTGRQARQPFIDDIIAQAARKNIRLVADDLAPLRLRRAK